MLLAEKREKRRRLVSARNSRYIYGSYSEGDMTRKEILKLPSNLPKLFMSLIAM